MARFLAIDQSTSATKALLFDEKARFVDKESREHRQYYPKPGWVEHDAEEIWRNTLDAIRGLLLRHPGAEKDLVGLSLTNQRETVVVFERGTGRPLYPAIVWQCRRGDPLCAAQVDAGREEQIQNRTGLRPDAYFSASKVQWIVRNHPEIRRKLQQGDALVGTIDAYLIYRFTNGSVFATDATNASRTLLFHLHERRWDPELCGWWEVPERALPEVRDCTARYGETNAGGMLSRKIPICGVMGDSQAALFGEGCHTPGTAKVTFGTGSSILLNVGSRPPSSKRGVVAALAWQIGGVPTYALEGIIISSAATLTWLRDQLGLLKSTEETEALAREVGDTQGVYLVPAFSGLGLPYWQPDARAAIVGLSSQSDRRHVARAGLESIAYQIRDALEAMESDAGVTVADLHADGGATSNRFLMQFTADLTGVNLRVAGMLDCSALGAALAGMLGLGYYKSTAELPVAQEGDTVYRPQQDAARVEQLYAGWHKAVRQTLAG